MRKFPGPIRYGTRPPFRSGVFFKYVISLVDSHSRHHLWFGAIAPDEEKRYRVDLDWAAENFPLGLEGGDSAESSSTQ